MCEGSGGGGGYLCLDELSMHALKGTTPRVGCPGVGMNLRGDQDVWARADVWDGPASSCAMEPMS